MNKYIARGNVTHDPELRRIPSGEAVVDFTLALNERWTDRNGDKKESVVFPRFSLWGTSGENFAKYVKKGDSLLVEAKYVQQTTEKDDEKRTFHSFRVLNWEFPGGSRKTDDNTVGKAEEKDEEVFDSAKKVETPKRERPARTQPVVEEDPEEIEIPF